MKVSVLMVTYNHERFIAQALASVLAQRVNFDYEIVVGEDCSTDGTRDIVMEFYRRNPKRIVPLLRSHNLGGAQNFMAALASCHGQYVASLEGDDYWTHEDKLQRQVDFLDAHPDYAMCCHRAQVLDEMGGGRAGVFPLHRAGSYAIEDLLTVCFVATCTPVYRRALVSPLPDWYSETELGDWALFALLAEHGKIELMDEIMAVYRVHSGGIWSSQVAASQIRQRMRMLTALDKRLEFKHSNAIRLGIARLYFEMAYYARQKGNRTETGKHLFNYIRNGGWQFRGSRRTLASFAAYTVFGSWYEAIRKARRAILR